jgi:O-antigen/teichoic acid export membrane protein
MQRKFIHNLLFVLLLNLLVKPFWILGIDVTVQNRVGAEEYGLYYPIFGFSILLNIILDFGITNYNSRTIARHSHMLGRYFSGIFNVKLILGGVYLLVTLSLGFLIGYKGKEIYLLLLLGINQILSSFLLYLRSNLSGLHLFKLEGLFSILDRLLMIILCSMLLWGKPFRDQFTIEWFVYAQFVAYFLTTFIAFIVVWKKAKFYRFRFDFTMFRVIFKESLPFALLVLLMSFYYRLDSVMIERMLPDGKYQAGVYAQAYRLLEGFNMFGYLFAGLLLPIFSRMLKRREPVGRLVQISFNLIFIPAVAIALISYFSPIEIMDMLYVENIEYSAELFKILMFSFVAIALTYIYGTLLTANGNLKALNLISLAGLVMNFTLNLILINSQGAKGAALATLVTQTFVILVQIVVTKRIFRMEYSRSFIFKHTAVLIIGLMISIYTQQYVDDLFLKVAIIIITFMGLTFLFGLIKKQEIMKLLRNREN